MVIVSKIYSEFYDLHSFFFTGINFTRILRLEIAKELWKFKNKQWKVEAQENFKYSYKKRVYDFHSTSSNTRKVVVLIY